MIKIDGYLGKKIELIDIDNIKWSGVVETYTPAIYTDEGIEEIGLLTVTDGLVSFKAIEVKSINEQE